MEQGSPTDRYGVMTSGSLAGHRVSTVVIEKFRSRADHDTEFLPWAGADNHREHDGFPVFKITSLLLLSYSLLRSKIPLLGGRTALYSAYGTDLVSGRAEERRDRSHIRTNYRTW